DWSSDVFSSDLSPESLQWPNAVVDGGRLAPQGGNYQALIAEIFFEFRGRTAALTVKAAEKLLEFAEAGLPIVLYGDWSAAHALGLRPPDIDAKVADLVDEAKAHSNVLVARTEAEIPQCLARLGVEQRVSHEFSGIKHVHRVAGGTDYFYFANVRRDSNEELEPIDKEVTVLTRDRDSIPCHLDPWAAETRPLAVFERSGRTAKFRLRLEPGQSALIAFMPRTQLQDP